MSVEDQKCVFLWVVPRSLSTAFTKCMSFVDGVQVWHEPYQYTYHKEKYAALAVSKDPTEQYIFQQIQKAKTSENGVQEVEEAPPRGKLIDDALFGYPWLKEQLETEDKDKELIFVKDIGCLLHGKYDYLPTKRKYRHTFLIRNPNHVYPSLRKILSDSLPEEYRELFDLRRLPFHDTHRAYQQTYELWQHVQENHLDPEPVIIDATDLAASPEKILPKYFEAIGIPWKEEYLTWPASSDVTMEWKASYKEFTKARRSGTHKAALESTHFKPVVKDLPSHDDLTEDVIACIQEAMPFYDKMYEQRLKP